jgi:hypothetical protein
MKPSSPSVKPIMLPMTPARSKKRSRSNDATPAEEKTEDKKVRLTLDPVQEVRGGVTAVSTG